MRSPAQTAPLPVEMLVSCDARRTSNQPPCIIDEAAADPILDHLPQLRSQQSRSRLLGILDSLPISGTEVEP